MGKDKILIIEDDSDLANLIKDYLSIEGFEGIIARDGKEGIDKALDNSISMIILDIMLPEVDGISVCKKIRGSSKVPIIMLSAKSGEMDKILSLGVGADDYMVKPFSPMELIARVKAHLRRQSYLAVNNEEEEVRIYGDMKLYPKSYKVLVNGESVPLTTREFQVLDFLTLNKDRVFSKEQLYEKIWGYSEYMDENTIAVYVKRLREKLGDLGQKSIKTVWGVGYKWEYDNE